MDCGRVEELASEIVLQGWASLLSCSWLLWTTSLYFQVSDVLTVSYRQEAALAKPLEQWSPAFLML